MRSRRGSTRREQERRFRRVWLLVVPDVLREHAHALHWEKTSSANKNFSPGLFAACLGRKRRSDDETLAVLDDGLRTAIG